MASPTSLLLLPSAIKRRTSTSTSLGQVGARRELGEPVSHGSRNALTTVHGPNGIGDLVANDVL